MLRSEDAEAELGAWYRNPWMLLSIGFIIGGLGGIYAAHSLAFVYWLLAGPGRKEYKALVVQMQSLK